MIRDIPNKNAKQVTEKIDIICFYQTEWNHVL